MKNLTFVLILISLFACNRKIDKTEASVEKFEKILGKQETAYLNEIVGDFDHFLDTIYPDRDSSFEKYLDDVSNIKVRDYWKPDSLIMNKYRASNLFAKYDTIYPDSVWYNGRNYNVKYPGYDLIEEIILFHTMYEDTGIESTINSLKNEPRFLLKEESSFYLALDTIQQSDSIITTYLQAQEDAGHLSPWTLANGLKYYLNKNNEYFAKRIFVMEMCMWNELKFVSKDIQ